MCEIHQPLPFYKHNSLMHGLHLLVPFELLAFKCHGLCISQKQGEKYCSMGKVTKQHLLVRGAKDSNFKVNIFLDFIPYNFLLMSSGYAIAELLVLDLFFG